MNHWPVRMLETQRGRLSLRERPGSGPAVVFIHGWPESSATWSPILPLLPDSWWVIAPDLRGLGDAPRTPEPAAYRKHALAQDVLALLDALGVGSFDLVGHDWGGIVAQEVALAAADRVRTLGVSNIAIINNLETNRRIAAKPNRYVWYQHFMQSSLPEALIPGNERAFLQEFLRMEGGRRFPDELLDEYSRCYAIPGTPRSAAQLYRTYRDDIARWSELSQHRFSMPAAYLYGELDVVITPAYLEGAEACFEDLQIHRMDAGHFVQEEQPEAFAAGVRALVARG